mgnify:CR=1 FL=1|jgi:serine/threonine protein phosphatase PrpC
MLAGPGGPVTCGPVRVIPGRLSVSRTFGDCQAKLEKYNGNPYVIVVDPEIHYVNIAEDSHDFILLGCDGIFDRLSTDVSCQEIWNSVAATVINSDQKDTTPKSGSKGAKVNNFRVKSSEDTKRTAGAASGQSAELTEQQFHQACGNAVDALLIRAMRF